MDMCESSVDIEDLHISTIFDIITVLSCHKSLLYAQQV